ncbi:MAG: protoporphyrinogen oxidase [Nitrospiraceae bacterium]
MAPGPHTVVVVGGGIAGLSAALELTKEAKRRNLALACRVLESAPTWGGKIVTHRAGGLLIEAGPDSFLSQKPWALDLCRELGLGDQLINTNDEHRKTYVYSQRRLRELPEGLVVIVPSKLRPFLQSGLLSWGGLARMGLECVVPRRQAGADESLSGFFRRRFGREATDRLIEPLMAGIYAGDATQMSIQATFPRFPELERQCGSLIRGLLAKRSSGPAPANGKPKHSLFVTLRHGLSGLVEALVERLSSAGVGLQTGVAVEALRVRSREMGRWVYDLMLSDGTRVAADAVILAVPAFASADLVRALSPSSGALLDLIPYASTATISLAYAEPELRPVIQGFGFVVPRVEERSLLAATWTSLKWADRAPAGQALVRCYLGGIGREAGLAGSDDDLVRLSREDLADLAGIRAQPTYVEVNRWHRGMPQYTVGHLDRLNQIEVGLSRYPGLVLTGAAYRGIGIPDCIREGQVSAGRIADYLGGKRN